MSKPRSYVNDWDEYQPRESMTVADDIRIGTVAYRDEQGKAFRVRIVQKPNPIGFRAQLPGDKRR